MEAPPVLQHHLVYPGMQAAPQQQQQLVLHPGHHQKSQIQAQGGMPAPQDGYGAVAGLHQQQQQQHHGLSGQKRDSSGATVQQHGSHDSGDANFVKLFVGSVPRTITEDEVRPMFAEHGNVLEVAIIKDKRTGNQQGCCFIKYSTVEEAERAIRALHNQRTLPGGVAPVQVRYADGERERLGAVEHKLFVGSLNKQASEKEIEELFVPYGRVDDVYIMRDEQKQSRGCAFIKYSQRDMAQAAITALNGSYIMAGCDQPLAVRFADPKRPKGADARVGGPGVGGPGFSPRQGHQGQQSQQSQQGPGGPRPMHGQMGHPGGRGPPIGWRPLGASGVGPPPQAGSTPYGSPAGPRGGPVAGVPQMGAMIGGPAGLMNGHPQGPMTMSGQMATSVMLAPPPQANQGYYQQTPQQRPQQQQQYVLQPPQQQQQQQQQQQPPQQQQQQMQQLQQSYVQMTPTQQQPQAYMQQQVPPLRPVLQVQPQQQQPPPQSQVLMQLQSQAAQQQHQRQQQQQHPLPEQGGSQQMGQVQNLQPGQQQAQQQVQQQAQQQAQQQSQAMQQLQPQQMYYQVPIVQPMQQQLQQPTYFLPVQQPQTLASVPTPQPPPTPATCEWSEHTSPEGYKYYYNGTSGESKWEKPEELLAFEQQQQPQIPQAVSSNPVQQQQQQHFTGTPVLQQHQLQGMTYMQPQPVNNGSVEQPRQQGPPGANLFVFRIPDDFTDESMKDTFAPFGNIISARVGVERESGRNRGFGFVSFDNAASAEAAIQGLNNVPVGGRRLKVERKRGEENGTQGFQQQSY